jgi:hypothetical protein
MMTTAELVLTAAMLSIGLLLIAVLYGFERLDDRVDRLEAWREVQEAQGRRGEPPPGPDPGSGRAPG